MNEIYPNYYHKFKCLAGGCKHSCCIGWEIDIDAETLAFYEALDTPLGEKIRRNIGGDEPHFILQEGERCPFLNEEGLCDIICKCGESALCEICTLHPRFRNFYSTFTETGLGLCCEGAAQIILSEREPFSVSLLPYEMLSEEESFFFHKREQIFSVLQNREISIGQRFGALAQNFGFSVNFSLETLRERYLSLERLDPAWTEVLNSLKGFFFSGEIFEEPEFSLPLEQLSIYFVFRHLSEALWDGAYAPRIRLAIMSCYIIGALWWKHWQEKGTISLEEMADFARMYSAEVEYSEENMEALLWNKE